MSTTGDATDVDGHGQPATSNSAAVSNSTSPGLPTCEECEKCPAVFYCCTCKTPLCAPCWDMVHRSKTTRNHKQMQIEEFLMVDHSLGHSKPTDAQMDADGKNILLSCSPIDHNIHLQPRLASLVPDPDARPSLVSFTGPSGVGKSTLVRVLASLNGMRDAGDMPLAGAENDAQSTSADIHIYARDQAPNSSVAQFADELTYPVLYLDSEGLGGTREPHCMRRLRAVIHDNDYSAFRNSRLKHVERSYPRMLYIFSDVLCFVFSGDWREQKSIVEPLLKWCTAAALGAANQHRPQLIIIFNKTDAIDVECDDFRKTYQKWIQGDKNGSGKKLARYYEDPLVVRLPHVDLNPHAFLRRVRILSSEIELSTMRIRARREEAHQLFTRCQLQLYMQLAAETFSKHPGAEFDIYKASMARRPPLAGLAGYIVEFFRAMQREQQGSKFDMPRISFNILKERIKWSMRLWIARIYANLPVGPSEQLPEYLRTSLEKAQKEIDDGLPCAAYVTDIGGHIFYCDTVSGNHLDGIHASMDRKAEGAHRWDGDFTPHPELQRAADACRLVNLAESGIRDPTPLDVKVIRRELSEVREVERREYGFKIFSSYLVCVCCIVELPTEVLSCGHIICAKCAEEEAVTHSPESIIDLTCPVCLSSAKWYPKDLPRSAGYRILSLDGGGVRGIVELTLLGGIMSFFPGMHVNDLFDIIVGTSSGGIIALALTVHALDEKPKTLPEVTGLFRKLCKDIFSPEMLRFGAGYKFTLRLFQLLRIYDTKYKADNLLKFLKEHIREESLLSSCVGGPRVIVTSCDRNNKAAGVWFTSYNRPMLENDDGKQTSEQALQGKAEGRVFDNHLFSAKDAAAATSAAGTYFPAYKAGNRDWIDGGVRFNCPAWPAIREARIMWPKRTASALISLGCGQFPPAKKTAFFDGDSIVSTLEVLGYVLTDAETLCRDAMVNLKNLQPNSSECSVRLNPTMEIPNGETCELDEVKKIPILVAETRKYLNNDGRRDVHKAANLLFAALFYVAFEIDQYSLKPNLNMKWHIRSRAALPRSLRDLLENAMLSSRRPFSVIVDQAPHADSELFWAECTWTENVMNLPFELRNLPMIRGRTVTVKLHTALPGTETIALPISGMPCSLDAAN